MIEFTPNKIKPPRENEHYLVISYMNMYHGGCFDRDKDGTSLSYYVAYYSSCGWNCPYVVAWTELPPFPQMYVNRNKKLLEERDKNLKPCYGTRCEVKMTNYTEIVDEFQIRDVVYIGEPPKNTPPKFDIVKWVDCEPHEVIDLRTGKKKIQSRYCYSVAFLEWNPKEPCFEFKSVGLRWLRSGASEDVIKMILDFAEKKHRKF